MSVKDERDYRRAEALRLDVEGLSEREIASKLMVANGTVHNDLVFLRKTIFRYTLTVSFLQNMRSV